MRRQVALLLSVVLLAVIAAGCGGGSGTGVKSTPQGSSAAKDGGTLYLGMFSAPRGVFNPVLFEDAYDSQIIGLVFEGLLTRNERMELVPRLAESYTVSPDNQTITFTLRQDVKWHDGKPFTANDVAFTFKTILHPRYTGVRASSYLDIEGALEYNAGQAGEVAGIRVRGPHEISFTTRQPYAPFLQDLAFPIIPEHLFREWPVERLAEHPATHRPVGTGPYKFVAYEPDQYVELVRHDEYFLGRPHIERVIYKVVNQEVALGQLHTGELDYAPARPEDLVLLQDDPNLLIHETPDFGYQYLGVNHRHPFLGDRQVRQALLHAIDRQAIVDRLLGGHGTVMNSPIPPTSWAYDRNGLNPYPYDLEKARALLAAAGFTPGQDGWLYRKGKRFEVSLQFPGGNKVRERSAPLIQDYLKAVGIKVNLEMLELSTLSHVVFDQQDMDLWLMGWSQSIDPDPGPIFLPTNKWGKVTGWTNPRSAQLIEQGVRVLSPGRRKPIYAEWAQILNTELPYLFLYSQNNIEVIAKRVQGLRPDARGILWNIHELWIPAAERKG